MNILLIGGTGVLSSAVMNHAIEHGFTVFILNRGNRPSLIHPKAILLKADIRNRKEVEASIGNRKFDVVADFLSYQKRELAKVLNIFKNRCKQFFFVSSCAVYKEPDLDGYYRETSLVGNDSWNYGIHKQKCEEYLKKVCSEIKLTYTIVRPAMTYGDTRIPYHIMPAYGWHWSIVARILHHKPIPYWDNGTGVTTVTHVSDFAFGFVGLFLNPKASNETFHITSDTCNTWSQIIECVGEIIEEKPVCVDVSKEFFANKLPLYKQQILGGRAREEKYDNSKIKKAVPGFECRINLKDGLMQTIKYYRENNYLKGIDYKWDADMDYLIDSYCRYTRSSTFYNLIFTPYLVNDGEMDRVIYNRQRNLFRRFFTQQIFILKQAIKKIVGRA